MKRFTVLATGLAALMAAISAPSPAVAAYHLHTAAITSIGCHTQVPGQTDAVKNTCFITVSPPAAAVGPCNPNDLRWDAGSVAGKNMLSVLQGAFLAGKDVNLGVKTDGCYVLQGGHGTFEFVYVLQ